MTFLPDQLSMPDNLRGIDIIKVEIASQIQPVILDITVGYVHRVQHTPHCNTLNLYFNKLIIDIAEQNPELNRNNATILQHELQNAIINTPQNMHK